MNMTRMSFPALLAAQILALSGPAPAQTIDFETLPDGTPTVDQQMISTEYEAAFGVSFEIVDSMDQHVSFPRLARVGSPRTAFQGCNDGDDLPDPGAIPVVGQTFLTDDGMLGTPPGDLKITYSTPVAVASGQMIDVDRGPGQYEEWVITARRGDGTIVDEFTLTAPSGPDTACASGAGIGPGEGAISTWELESPDGVGEIVTVRFRYTGTVTGVGIAFDNFSPAILACRSGNVNSGNRGVSDVLFVNGQTGVVTVPVGEALTVSLDGAPAGPASGNYVLWVWAGLPTTSVQLVSGDDYIGCLANPTPLHEGMSPQAFLCLHSPNLPRAICRGVRDLNAPPAAPWSATKPGGFSRATTLTIQGVLRDPASSNSRGFSVTNAVILVAEDP